MPFSFGIILFAAVVCAGCSDSGKAPGTDASVAPKSVKQTVTQSTATVAANIPQPVNAYNPVGKRDPFAPLVTRDEKKSKAGDRPPLERYNLLDFKLSGIVWGGFGYNAMLEGPDGKGYFVRVGTVIGANRGVVKKITQNVMVIEEKFKTATGAFDRKEIIIELQKKQEGKQ